MTGLLSVSGSDRHRFCEVPARIAALAELAEHFHEQALQCDENGKPNDRAAAVVLRALDQIAGEQRESKGEGDSSPQQLMERLPLPLAQQVLRALRGEVDEQPSSP